MKEFEEPQEEIKLSNRTIYNFLLKKDSAAVPDHMKFAKFKRYRRYHKKDEALSPEQHQHKLNMQFANKLNKWRKIAEGNEIDEGSKSKKQTKNVDKKKK